MAEIANPESYFAISLELCAVRQEDFDRVHAALLAVRDEFSCGGSGMSVENVRPGTVLNR